MTNAKQVETTGLYLTKRSEGEGQGYRPIQGLQSQLDKCTSGRKQTWDDCRGHRKTGWDCSESEKGAMLVNKKGIGWRGRG